MMTAAPYQSLNDRPFIEKFITGVYNLKPPTRKRGFVWDVSIIFGCFENCGPNGEFSEKVLMLFQVLFLLLLGGKRTQFLLTFHIVKMMINDISVSFVTTQLLKQSRKGSKQDRFKYDTYEKLNLCVIACLKDYLSRRNNRTNHKQMIITNGKPHKPASIDSIRRWVKELFTDVRIDNFTPHSCHAASASKVAKQWL